MVWPSPEASGEEDEEEDVKILRRMPLKGTLGRRGAERVEAGGAAQPWPGVFFSR